MRAVPNMLPLVVCCLAISALEAGAEEPYVQHMDVVYGETAGVGLLMDVFTPTGKSNGLGVVDVASGAWSSDRGKINDHKLAQTYRIFCSRGYTMFAVRPGSIAKFSAPEMLVNLNRGIRWAKAHHQDYGIDPDRLGLTGASAGGHLACLAAVTAEEGRPNARDPLDRFSTRAKAVSVFFPPTDFLDWNGEKVAPRGEGRLSQLLGHLLYPGGINGQSDAAIAEQITKISPTRLVTAAAPPFLVIHGDADPVVPLQQSQVFVAALQKEGVPVQLIVKPGGGHPWLTIPEEVAKTADWFDEQLNKTR